jgi:hypothetical protein
MPYADPEKQKEAKRLHAAKKYAQPAHRKKQQKRALEWYHQNRTDDLLETRRRASRARRSAAPSGRTVTVTRKLEGSSEQWAAWAAAQEASGKPWSEWIKDALDAHAKRKA